MANKKEKEAKHVSITVKWVAAIVAVILGSFVVFSIIIYSNIEKEFLSQQEQTTQGMLTTLTRRLTPLQRSFNVGNVVPSLSPNTERILQSESGQLPDQDSHDVLHDDVLALLSNPDIAVAIFSPDGEIAFSDSSNIPHLHKFAGQTHRTLLHQRGRTTMRLARKVYSRRTGRLLGYVQIDNAMGNYNRVMNRLHSRMWLWAVLTVLLCALLSYAVVTRFVKPIKTMSRVANSVDEDPETSARIPDLQRKDELSDLAVAFNRMLDRMQGYIDQQKQFVGDVSHELRTPVAVIKGHLSMLQRWGKDDPEVLAESIKASLQETDRMNHLIQEMLDLTRAEQVDVLYPNAVTAVVPELNHVVADMRLVHPDFKINLDLDTLDSKTQIKVYQNHFEQLLIILLDNAVKYSTDRKEIQVSAARSAKRVDVVVQDFGEGIAPENLAKIFNRFYRVDKSRTRAKGGNGLGLAIAQKLTQSYHGEISVDSALGSGSSFKLSFPVADTPGKKPNEALDQETDKQ